MEPKPTYTTFKKAVKYGGKLRMALAGPAGSGKTYSALRIATALANGGKIALVDTEHGSASKYADIFAFDVLELGPPFHPKRYGEAIRDASEAGYSVVILDSLSHAWNGDGGLLDIVDQIAKRMKTSNTFAAWKDATPIQNRLIEDILTADLHVIATMRSKQDYIIEQDDKGRSRPRKVGMAPIQRDGFEYEFDVFGELDIDANLIITKTRCPALEGGLYPKPGEDVAAILVEWLSGEPAPEPPKPLTREEALAGNGDSADEKKQPPPARPVTEIDPATPLQSKPAGWLALASELVYRGIGDKATLANYTPPEGLQPLWPGDTPKFNGHAGKHYLGEAPPDIHGTAGLKALKLTRGQAMAFRDELVARAGLLEMLPAVAVAFEEKTGGVVKGDVALAKVISTLFGSAHGKTWRKWERAVRDELQPKEIFELQGKIVDGVLFTAVDLSGAAEEEAVTEIETTLSDDISEDIVSAIFGDTP